MNIPPEVVRDLPTLVAFVRGSLLSGLEGQVGGFTLRQLRRAFGRYIPVLRDADPHELELRIGRAETTLLALSSRITAIQSDYEIGAPDDDEMREPATGDFVADAFSASMGSPCAQKREVIGVLIAQRLYAATESEDELYLRQALEVTRRSNKAHLNLLATLSMVHNPPRPTVKMHREDVEKWLDENAFSLLNTVCSDTFTTSELQYLDTIGAVNYSNETEMQTIGFGGARRAPPVAQMIIEETGEQFLNAPGIGHGAFYEKASELYSGRFSREAGFERLPLAAYRPTRAGYIVANGVLDSISNRSCTPNSSNESQDGLPGAS
jgi:hypothetical protein